MKSASGSTQLATTFGYDPATGLVSSVQAWEQGHSQPQVTTTYGHDGFLPTSEAWSTTDPSWHVAGTVAYDYDVAFTVGSVAVTSGANTSTVSYTRDLDGLITAAGALAITRENATNAPTHNSGRVTGTSLGVVSTTQDDCPGSAQVCTDFGELADFTARSGGTSVYSYSFTRDGLGRITRNVETILGATSTYDYEYEEAGRLAHVRKDGALLRSYGYDLNGNREYENGAPVAWFDAQDRLLSHGQEVFTYGRTGALETRSGPGGVTTYAYDTFGSLRSVALPGGTRVDYLVDGLNRRVGKKVNGVQVEGFLYDGQLRPVAWLDGSGAVYARFVYGLHVSVPEYMVTGAGTFRFLTDHLGSPRLVVNTSTGAVMQRIDYDEWGQVLADSNPGFQPFGFAGGLYDRDTGLVRFGARDYDPSVGRWTAKDPIGFEGGLNFYEYCGGDPVNFVDPEGRSWAGVRRTIGVIWGAPQELIGIIYGGAGWLLGGDATFSNNGILFENNPIQLAFGGENSAITFGHSMCLASRGDFIRPENGYSTAAHEEQHTYQSEVTGPFYLPVAGVSLLVGALVDGDEHGPYSFMETGPQSSPPRPWPWGGK